MVNRLFNENGINCGLIPELPRGLRVPPILTGGSAACPPPPPPVPNKRTHELLVVICTTFKATDRSFGKLYSCSPPLVNQFIMFIVLTSYLYSYASKFCKPTFLRGVNKAENDGYIVSVMMLNGEAPADFTRMTFDRIGGLI